MEKGIDIEIKFQVAVHFFFKGQKKNKEKSTHGFSLPFEEYFNRNHFFFKEIIFSNDKEKKKKKIIA